MQKNERDLILKQQEMIIRELISVKKCIGEIITALEFLKCYVDFKVGDENGKSKPEHGLLCYDFSAKPTSVNRV